MRKSPTHNGRRANDAQAYGESPMTWDTTLRIRRRCSVARVMAIRTDHITRHGSPPPRSSGCTRGVAGKQRGLFRFCVTDVFTEHSRSGGSPWPWIFRTRRRKLPTPSTMARPSTSMCQVLFLPVLVDYGIDRRAIGRNQNLRWAAHSCNGFSAGVNPDTFRGPGFQSGYDPVWMDLLHRHSELPFHALVGGGDQLYCDR
jgi:hypothetical protein